MIYSTNWITLEKACQMLNMTIDELNKLIDCGEISTTNTSLGVRILKHTVEGFINRRKTG